MFRRILLVALVATTPLFAQGGGGGSKLQDFADKLKIDKDKELPAVTAMFAEAAKEAAPLATEMVALRQKLVNFEIANKPDEAKLVLDDYTAAAAKMAVIEAKVFARVYATLKPYQQAGAPKAFDAMAGFFQASAPRGGGRGGRGGGQ